MDGKHVQTVEELIVALGGTKAAREALDASSQRLWNWKSAGRLPTRLYFQHRQRLAERGLSAPESLWGIEPAEADGAAA